MLGPIKCRDHLKDLITQVETQNIDIHLDTFFNFLDM